MPPEDKNKKDVSPSYTLHAKDSFVPFLFSFFYVIFLFLFVIIRWLTLAFVLIDLNISVIVLMYAEIKHKQKEKCLYEGVCVVTHLPSAKLIFLKVG